MTPLGVGLGLLSALVFGVASVVQADAVRGFDEDEGLAAFLRQSVRSGRVWLVVGAYLMGFALHAAAIWLVPLYLAQATIAMQLPVTALLGARIEGALGRRRWLAVGVVTAGLVLLTLGAGRAGGSASSTTVAATSWGAIAALAALSRLAPRLGGAALGVLGGIGYAGSALAVRGLSTPVTASVILTAVAVPAFSVVAFWLYSLAMRRARVSSASAALIVVQTLLPAAVGVVALGDQIRDGWLPAVIAGLALATTGAVVLSRDTARSDGVSEVAGAG